MVGQILLLLSTLAVAGCWLGVRLGHAARQMQLRF